MKELKQRKDGNYQVHKLFFAWEEEKEKKWLEDMALNGYFLIKVLFGKYLFRKDTPKEVRYDFDFILWAKSNNEKDEYIKTAEEQGWQHICDIGVWMYFMTYKSVEKTAPIYTDKDSKIKQLSRLLAFLIIITLPGFHFIIIQPVLYKNGNVFSNGFMLGFRIFYSVLFLFLIYSMIKIAIKIFSLKKR